MTHSPVDKVFDLTCNWHLVALFLEHSSVKSNVTRDESQVELEVGVLEMVAVALFVDLISCLSRIAFYDCIEVLQPLLLVCPELPAVES